MARFHQMRRLFACHHSSHSQFLKEQMSTTQINVTTEVFQKFFRQQERCSSRHHVYTQCSIDTSNSNRGLAIVLVSSVPSLPKTEKSWLFQTSCSTSPTFCEHPPPTFRQYFVQSRSVSILCQSLPFQCDMACCGLLQKKTKNDVFASSPSLGTCFPLFGLSRAHCPFSRQMRHRVREINSLMLSRSSTR